MENTERRRLAAAKAIDAVAFGAVDLRRVAFSVLFRPNLCEREQPGVLLLKREPQNVCVVPFNEIIHFEKTDCVGGSRASPPDVPGPPRLPCFWVECPCVR